MTDPSDGFTDYEKFQTLDSTFHSFEAFGEREGPGGLSGSQRGIEGFWEDEERKITPKIQAGDHRR